MILVLGQVLEGPAPVGTGNSLGVDDLTILQQVDLDGLGTGAVLVIVVIPGLGTGNGNGFWVVGVGDGIAIDLGAGDDRFVALDCDLSDGVDDFLAGLELIQIGEGGGPVVAIIQNQGLAGGLAVGDQFDGDVVGTEAILVALVLPGLGDGNGGLLGSVGVSDVVAVDLGGVALDSLLLDGVVDEGAVILELGQIGKGPCPVIAGDLLRVDNLAVLQQIDGDGIGTGTVLVIVVVPGLGTGNGDGFGLMGVDDGVANALVALDDGHITGNVQLLDGVGDDLAVCVLVQLGERAGPVVAVVQNQRLAGILAIGQQLDGDILGAEAVLVAVVLPGLGDGDGGLLGSMGVDDVEAVVGGGVILDRLLDHGVLNGLALLILGQIVEGPGPAIVSGDDLGVDDLAIGGQMDGDGLRTGAILVKVVVPGLGTGNVHSFDLVGVGDGVALGLGAGDGGGVAAHGDLLDGVGDLLTGLVHIQTGEGAGPAVAVVQNQSLAGIHAVSEQLDGDVVGTDAILVALIVPGLGHGDGGLVGGMGVGDVVAVVGGGVAIHLVLGDGVLDQLAVLELGQVGEGPAPVGTGDSLGGDDLAVFHQIDGDGGGADTVLVAVVVPGLGAGNLGHSGNMGVGDGVAADGRGVALDGDLAQGVIDDLGVAVLVQIGELAGPAGGSGQSQSLAGVNAVGKQLDGDGGGTDAVLVARIVPDLGHGNLGLLHLMGVGDGQAVDLGGVAGDSILGDGVDNGLAVGAVQIQAVELVLPAVLSGQLSGGDLHAVAPQVDGDGAGTGAVLVIGIVPDLGDLNGGLVNLVGVGQRDLGVLEGGGGGVVLAGIQLYNGVDMDLALGLVDQIIGLAVPGVAPVVVLIQNNRCADGTVALHELDSDGGGTDAVLVVLVVPDLGDGDISALQGGLDTGNGEGVLLALDVQIGLLVGGIVLPLHEALKLGIEGDTVGVSIDIVGFVALGLGGDIAQLPGVVGTVLVEALTGTGGHIDVGSHGVGGGPALAAEAAGDGLGDGLEGGIQLTGIVGIVSAAGAGHSAAQEGADGNIVVGIVTGSTEADGVELCAGIADGSGLGSSGIAVGLVGAIQIGVADALRGSTVRQQHHILGGDVADLAVIKQAQSQMQATLHIGAGGISQTVDGAQCVAILVCAASNIAPVQIGTVAAVEGDDGQHSGCIGIVAGIGDQEVLGSNLGSIQTVLAAIRTAGGMAASAAAIGTGLHGAGRIDDQNNGAGIGLGCDAGAGLDRQCHFVGVGCTLDGLGGLGQFNRGTVHVIADGAGAALDPLSVFIVTVDRTVIGCTDRDGRCGYQG